LFDDTVLDKESVIYLQFKQAYDTVP